MGMFSRWLATSGERGAPEQRSRSLSAKSHFLDKRAEISKILPRSSQLFMLPILFFALTEVLKYSPIFPNRRCISSFISAALASTILYMLTLPKFDFSTKTMLFEILLPQTATSSDAFISILLSVFSLFIIKERLISITRLS